MSQGATMDCAGADELLQAHLDAELDPAERALVDAHLAGCAACRAARGELEVVGEALRALLAAREAEPVAVTIPGVAPAAPAGAGGAGGAPAARGAPRQLGGYRLEGELARGGMGTVYRAVQLSMDRPVALKVLAPRLAADEEFVARFLREARVAATIQHPNAIAIYDVGRDGDRLYYSMELVAGEDLEARLARRKHLPPREAVALAAEVAGALGAAHAAGIVHRDVKPANVLVTEAGGVKLADLGLAKELGDGAGGSLTVGRKVIGSPNYMSPEQAGDLRDATARSDVYALGATLLHLLTGELPFRAASAVEVIARVLRDPPALPERLPDGAPLDPALRALLEATLAKDPAQRPADGAELEAALRGWLAGTAQAAGAKDDGAAAPGRGKRAGRRAVSSDANLRARQAGREPARESTSGRVKVGSAEHPRAPRRARAAGPPWTALAAAAGVLAAVGLAFALGRGTGGARDAAAEAGPRAPRGDDAAGRGPEGGAPAPTVAQVLARERAGEGPAGGGAGREGGGRSGADAPAPGEAGAGAGAGEAGALAVAGEPAGEDPGEARWREAARAAGALEAEGRWGAAIARYAAFLAEAGPDAPRAGDARLALRAAEAQVSMRLEGDLVAIDEALARGDASRAEAVAAAALAYGGEDAGARARARLEAGRRAAPAPVAQAGRAQPAAPADAPAPGAPAAPAGAPAPAGADALAAREARGRELLAEARARLEAGDRTGARESLGRAREEAGDLDALRGEVDALVALLDKPGGDRPGGRPGRGAGDKPGAEPALEALVALAFEGRAELLAADGKARVRYDFSAPEQADDWLEQPLEPRESRMFLEGLPSSVAARDEAWKVRDGRLLAAGWTRRRHVAAWRVDAPLRVEATARGPRNLLVGLSAGRTWWSGVGYLFDEELDRGIDDLVRVRKELKGALEPILRQSTRTRERGPAAVVLQEQGGRTVLFDELSAVPHGALPKSVDLVLDLAPRGQGHDLSAGVAKKASATVSAERVSGPARPLLTSLGARVEYDQLTVSGWLDPTLLERLRRVGREQGADREALRRALREE